MFRSDENRRRRSRKERLQAGRERLVSLVREVGPYLFLVVVAAGIPYGVFHGYNRVMTSPYFEVTDVEVRGANYVDVPVLADQAGLVKGLHIFDVDLDRATRALEASPWIKGADVQRQLPDRVVARVHEYEPAAVVANRRLTVVTAEGTVIKSLDSEDPVGRLLELPMITGLSPDELSREFGRRLFREALEVVELYQQTGMAREYPLSEVHVDPVLGMTLTIQGTATEVRLGRGEYRTRLERLRALRKSLAEREIEPAYILLDQATSLNRVTVGRRRTK